MTILVAAALIGAGLTIVLTWDFGVTMALVCAPFGGSVFAFMAAAYLMVRRTLGDLGELENSLPSGKKAV